MIVVRSLDNAREDIWLIFNSTRILRLPNNKQIGKTSYQRQNRQNDSGRAAAQPPIARMASRNSTPRTAFTRPSSSHTTEVAMRRTSPALWLT
jgi:hypothetical protein